MALYTAQNTHEYGILSSLLIIAQGFSQTFAFIQLFILLLDFILDQIFLLILTELLGVNFDSFSPETNRKLCFSDDFRWDGSY